MQPNLFEQAEETETDMLRVRLPKIEEFSNESRELTELETEQEDELATEDEEELVTDDEEEQEVELEIDSDEDGLKLKSKGVTARTTSAKFTLSHDGMVTLTTPSGNTHQLRNYPDQAIRVMLSKGKMELAPTLLPSSSPRPSASPDLDIDETPEPIVTPDPDELAQPLEAGEVTDLQLLENPEGEVIYQANVKTKKKFLGIVPWEVDERYQLNDTTNEVSVELAESATILDQVINLLSIE